MRLPHPPPSATRFWAKPLAGWLECPRCGKVLYFQSTPKGRQRGIGEWDKHTGRLRCPPEASDGCGLVMVIGLIAWPVQGGVRRTVARDQVPNERQLSQMRAMAELGGGGAGWWMPKDQAKRAKRPDDTNITAGCTCREGTENTSQQDPGCPIHGTGVAYDPPGFVDDEGEPI